jgi:hypothetical protein
MIKLSYFRQRFPEHQHPAATTGCFGATGNAIHPKNTASYEAAFVWA